MALAATEFAPAKVNLALHVTGQRADGYHLLDSLVAFADLGDTLDIAAGEGLTLTVEGPRAAGVPVDGSNLVMRALVLMGAQDMAMTLTKRLPAAAGIGGGSSDAAAAVRAAARLMGRDLDAELIAALAGLGADVPVCLAPQTQRMEGVGERLTLLAPLPEIHVLLVNTGIHHPTPQVFKALVQKENAPLPAIPAFRTVDDVIGWLAATRNDLEPPAIAGAPVIGEVLAALRAAPFSRMSGSGATCFALFHTAAAAASYGEALRARAPGWWVEAAKLLP